VVFHSFAFLGFFAAVVAGNYALRPRLRWAGLLAASLYFYAVSDPRFLVQVLAATALCFALGLRIEAAADRGAKKRLLTAGVLLLIGNLIAFKYASFINESLRALFAAAGAAYPVPMLGVLLPIGISFYTFQLISYLVDIFRGTVKAERHPGIFALYVLFFPKLIAGPIERAKQLLPQLHAEHRFDYQQVVDGLQLMLWGAFKKLVVADRLDPVVAQVYDNPHAANGVTTVIGTWLYAFQIYCDFSGYTDMALGTAAVLGYKLTQNFNRPYLAISIQDFWKRWHISLTTWLTDYVHTPLSRQRLVKMKFYHLMLLSVFVTFVVSGFWHGAAWSFVVWGALHGLYAVASVVLRKPRQAVATRLGLLQRPRLHHAVKVAVTFNLVCFAYIFFRAPSLADAAFLTTRLLTGWPHALSIGKAFVEAHLSDLVFAGFGILVVAGAELLQERRDLTALFAARPWLRWSLYYAGAASILLLGAFYDRAETFIYFRF